MSASQGDRVRSLIDLMADDGTIVPVGRPGEVIGYHAGTGTVGLVAQSLSRRAVLIDLNPDYLRQCLARNAQTPLGLMG